MRGLASQLRELRPVDSHVAFQADLRLLPYRFEAGRGFVGCAVNGDRSLERASGDTLGFFGQRLERGLG